MAKYTVYCDGSYSSQHKQSGSGVVIMKDNDMVLCFNRSFKGGTNNRGELFALILAMKSFTKPVDEIEFVSDSLYCINTINGAYKIRKNIKLWKLFFHYYDKLKQLCNNITFTWVKGHSVCEGNIYADELANNASTNNG